MEPTIAWTAIHTMETWTSCNLSVVTATTQKEATPVTIVYGRNSKWIKNQSLKSWNPMGSKDAKNVAIKFSYFF